jgi:hypothetical protein
MDWARINFGIFGPRKELMDWAQLIFGRIKNSGEEQKSNFSKEL